MVMVPKIKVNIDGKAVEVDKGKTVLQLPIPSAFVSQPFVTTHDWNPLRHAAFVW